MNGYTNYWIFLRDNKNKLISQWSMGSEHGKYVISADSEHVCFGDLN